MKAWLFWMALTFCCMTLMPFFVARSLLAGSRATRPPAQRSPSPHAR